MAQRRALALAVCLAMLAATCSAQPAQSARGISLQDICAVQSRGPGTLLAKRPVMGTGCTVFVDCSTQPLTATACGAGQRFSMQRQGCVPAPTAPCYEDQFPAPASVPVNRAVAKAAVPPAAAINASWAGDISPDSLLQQVTWTPLDWQRPALHTGVMAAQPNTVFSQAKAAATTAGGYAPQATPADNSRTNATRSPWGYDTRCNTVAFDPVLHTPPASSGITVPAGTQFVQTCSTCYPALLCPTAPAYNPRYKGDYMTLSTIDYYACKEGQVFDGQACVGTPAPPSPASANDVQGSVTTGIDCAAMHKAIAAASANNGTTFRLVDTKCASVDALPFQIVNATTNATTGVERVTIQYNDPSKLRWVKAQVYNATTGVRGKSGDDQYTVQPTLTSTFEAITSGGSCLYVPVINDTAAPPPAGIPCPAPADSVTTVSGSHVYGPVNGLVSHWGAFMVGTIGVLALAPAVYESYVVVYTALESLAFDDLMLSWGTLGLATVDIGAAIGAAVAIVLLVAVVVVLALMWAGVIPPDLGLSSGCFPSSATVLGLLATASMLGPVPMGQLALGDAVASAALAPGGGYGAGITASPVYLWGHRDAHMWATFVELTTASGHSVQMTGGHFIHTWPALAAPSAAAKDATALVQPMGCHVDGAASASASAGLLRMKRAEDVSVDGAEQLCVYDDATGTFSLSPVVGKRLVQAQGLYAPFSTSGDLVVNGVVVSAHSDWMLDRIVPAKAVHHLPAIYQALMWPARAAYALGGRRLMEFLDTRLRLVELASALRL